MDEKRLERLKKIFFAALLIEDISMEEWCKRKEVKYKSLLRWFCKGFPEGKSRKSIKGKQALQEILTTIDEVGLSNKVDPMWSEYYDFKS